MQGEAELRVLQVRVLHAEPAQLPAPPEERARGTAQGVRVFALPVRVQAQPEAAPARADGAPEQQGQARQQQGQGRRWRRQQAAAAGAAGAHTRAAAPGKVRGTAARRADDRRGRRGRAATAPAGGRRRRGGRGAGGRRLGGRRGGRDGRPRGRAGRDGGRGGGRRGGGRGGGGRGGRARGRRRAPDAAGRLFDGRRVVAGAEPAGRGCAATAAGHVRAQAQEAVQSGEAVGHVHPVLRVPVRQPQPDAGQPAREDGAPQEEVLPVHEVQLRDAHAGPVHQARQVPHHADDQVRRLRLPHAVQVEPGPAQPEPQHGGAGHVQVLALFLLGRHQAEPHGARDQPPRAPGGRRVPRRRGPPSPVPRGRLRRPRVCGRRNRGTFVCII